MRVALIDADTLVYEATRSSECEIQWDENLWTLHGHFDPARAKIDDTVALIMERLSADRVVMALSDYNEPWRKQVYPLYKANRKNVRKPLMYEPIRQYIHESFETVQMRGLEGDDVLGLLLTEPSDEERIVVSIDKDMQTLPGLHINLMHARKNGEAAWEPRFIAVPDADHYHMLQALMGDTTDGYPGCPGIGRVRAERILSEFCTEDGWFDTAAAWKAIVAQYVKAGLGETEALTNARVARILRTGDYDHDNLKVILWEPALP